MKPIQLFILGIFFNASWLAGQISLQRWVISSWGNTTSTAGIYLSQTAGQPSNTAKFNNQLIINQGFQQGYSIQSKIYNADEPEIKCFVYPNPFVHEVHVTLNTWEKDYTLLVIHLAGQTNKTIPCYLYSHDP